MFVHPFSSPETGIRSFNSISLMLQMNVFLSKGRLLRTVCILAFNIRHDYALDEELLREEEKQDGRDEHQC